MQVLKRDGTLVPFEKEKIRNAVLKAFMEVDKTLTPYAKIKASNIAKKIAQTNQNLTVEEIQDMVVEQLMASKRKDVANSFIEYRHLHKMARDKYKELIGIIKEKLSAENVANQNANVDEKSFGGRVGETSDAVMKLYALDFCMSEMSRNNHLNNEIYIHDLSHYAIGDHNCLSVPFDDLLAKGFTTRQTDVRPAQSINTAFQLIAVIFQIQSLQQFG